VALPDGAEDVTAGFAVAVGAGSAVVVVATDGGSGVGFGSAAVDVRVVGRDTGVAVCVGEGFDGFDAPNAAGGVSGAGCGPPVAARTEAGEASAAMQPPAITISRHRRRDLAPVVMTLSLPPAP